MADRSQRQTYAQGRGEGSYYARGSEPEYPEERERYRQNQGFWNEDERPRGGRRYENQGEESNYGSFRHQGYGREEYGAAYGESEGRGYGRESGYGGSYGELTGRGYGGSEEARRSNPGQRGRDYNQQDYTQGYYNASQSDYGRRHSNDYDRRAGQDYGAFSERNREDDRYSNEGRSSRFGSEDDSRSHQGYQSSGLPNQRRYEGGSEPENYGQRSNWQYERSNASFAGRGPKGYKRSDERLTEDINERLMHHPGIDASEIEVSVMNGEVTLSGTVGDRRAKHLAEDLVDAISGVSEVNNQIRVSRTESGARENQPNKQADGQPTGTTSGMGVNTDIETQKMGVSQGARGKSSS